jgi:hypothetical protein
LALWGMRAVGQLWGRLFCAILGGVAVTVLTVALGVYCSPSFPFVYTGRHESPTRAGIDDDSHVEGWVKLANGEVRQFREQIGSEGHMRFFLERSSAGKAGRPAQYATYLHLLRGSPTPCVQYYWRGGRVKIQHESLAAEGLQSYPTYKFKSIVWLGFIGDVLIWAVILYVVCSIPSQVRRYLRKRGGRCLRCGYQLRGLTESRCPECGREFDAAEATS